LPYMQGALLHLRKFGEIPEEEQLTKLSPMKHCHINMLKYYTFSLLEDSLKGERRPLNFKTNNKLTS
ncbi:hypothetical protein ACHU48_004542, partial [Escherichia coli]